jgi:hypothetical protein
MSPETLQVLSHLELNPKLPKKQSTTEPLTNVAAEDETTKGEPAPTSGAETDKATASDAPPLVSSKDALPGLPNRKARREVKKAEAVAVAVAGQATEVATDK